jgi:hypothetical protein
MSRAPMPDSASGETPMPSSFDDELYVRPVSLPIIPLSFIITHLANTPSLSSEFWEESRSAKLFRKLRQEPLVPLGLGLTCYALFGATRSIRRGDKEATNRYFRARVYAQAFTLICVCAGALYWKEDREKRKTYRGLLDEKRSKEKREAWIRELEIREVEDERERERRRERRRRMGAGGGVEVEEEGMASMAVEGAKQAAGAGLSGSSTTNPSPFEQRRLRELVGGRGILGQAMALWWSSSSSTEE